MKKLIVAGASFLLPAVVLAQANLNYVSGTLNVIQNLIRIATPIVIGLALLFFLYGLMTFILAAGNEEAKDRGKRIMIWGIVALFIMVSVWGIVNLLNQNLGVNQGVVPTVPSVP